MKKARVHQMKSENMLSPHFI